MVNRYPGTPWALGSREAHRRAPAPAVLSRAASQCSVYHGRRRRSLEARLQHQTDVARRERRSHHHRGGLRRRARRRLRAPLDQQIRGHERARRPDGEAHRGHGRVRVGLVNVILAARLALPRPREGQADFAEELSSET